MKIKAYELRSKKKDELLKQLEELKSELAQVRPPPRPETLLACRAETKNTCLFADTLRGIDSELYSFAWRK